MADTTLSNFPATIDSFDRVSDLDETTLKKSETYKKKIDSGDYTGAEQYLKDNPDLARCAINATIINKHSDAIVALENEFTNMDSGLTIPDVAEEENTEYIAPIFNNRVRPSNSIRIVGSGGTTLSRKDSRTIDISSFEYIPSGKGKKLGKFYTDNIESIYYTLYYQSFELRSKDLNNFPDGQIYIPDTDWYLTSGLPNGGYEKVLVGIEGSLIVSRNMYPLGYNDGNILVNAYMGREAVSPYSYRMIISYKGIQKNNITAVRGILKYTIATA